MAIRSNNVKKTAAIAQECIQFALGVTAFGQTALLTDSVTVPYPFQILSVEAWCVTTAATITLDVQIGSTSALASVITPTAATKVAGTLSATVANTQTKTKNGVLNLLYTSNGSGAATNAYVSVWIRPLGMEGDALPIKE